MEMESRRRQDHQMESHEESSEEKSPHQETNAENNQQMLTSGKEVVQYEPSKRKEKTDKEERNDESKKVIIIPDPVRQVRSKSMVEIRKPKTYTTSFASTSKRAVVPKPVENFVPQITVPQPFNVSIR
ncbi:unnamed protein product [Cylicostephanus goldi]|uniref:Uncharacterized protein n=1 Tax=Cylicostephanus goldi TaxID=71465 RepID=A0A3P6V686_CYLGO|nr:unnamed protein product [Cylicostephanus goldi]